MFTMIEDAIKRVISGEDILDGEAQQQQDQEPRGNNHPRPNDILEDTRTSMVERGGGPMGMDIEQYPPPPATTTTTALTTMGRHGQQVPPTQRPSVNLVENDVDMIIFSEGPPPTTTSCTAPRQDNDVAATGATRTTQQAYHYWTSAQSETPRSSLSDLSAAPPALQHANDHDNDGFDHDDTDIDIEDSGEVDVNMIQPNEGNQGGLINDDDNINNTMDTAPPRAMSRMMNSSIQQQQQQQQGLQDWESTMKEMKNNNSSNTDRNSDESSSVGKTGNSQSSSRDWGWFEDVHASSDRPWSSGRKDSPARDGRKHNPKDSGQATAANTSNTQRDNSTNNQNSGDESRSNNTNSNKRKTATSRPPTGLLLPSQNSLFFPTETWQPLVQHDPESGESMTVVFGCADLHSLHKIVVEGCDAF